MNQLTLSELEDGFLEMGSVPAGPGLTEIELAGIPSEKRFSVRTDQFHLPALEGGAGRGKRVEGLVRQVLEYIRTSFENQGLLGQADLLVLDESRSMSEEEAQAKAHREYGRLMRESWQIESDGDLPFRPVAIIIREAEHKRIVYRAIGVFGPQATGAQSAVTPIDEAALAREVGNRCDQPSFGQVMPTILRDLLELGFRAYLYGNVVNRAFSRAVNVFADDLLFDMTARKWKRFMFWSGWGFDLKVSAHGNVRAIVSARKYQFPEDSAGYQALASKSSVTIGGMTVGRRYRRDARSNNWRHIEGLVASNWGEKPENQMPEKRDKQVAKMEKSRLLVAGFVNQHFEAFLRRAGIAVTPVQFDPSLTMAVQRPGKDGWTLNDEMAIGHRLAIVLPERDPSIEAWLAEEIMLAGFQFTITWATSPNEVRPDVPILHVSRSLTDEDDASETSDKSIWVTLTNTKTAETVTRYPADLDEVLERANKRDWRLLACDPYTETRLAMHRSDMREWRPIQNINTANLRAFNKEAPPDPLKRALLELALKSFAGHAEAHWPLNGVDETIQGQYLAINLRAPAKAPGRVSAMRFKIQEDGLQLLDRIARSTFLPKRGNRAGRVEAMIEAVGDAAADLWLPELEDVLCAPGGAGIPVHDNLFLLVDLDRGRVLRSVHGHPVLNPSLLYREGTPIDDPAEMLASGWWSRTFNRTAVPHLVMPTDLPVAIEPRGEFARVAFRLIKPENTIAKNTQVRDYLVHDLRRGTVVPSPHATRVFGANLALLTTDFVKAGQTSRMSLIEKLVRLLAIN